MKPKEMVDSPTRLSWNAVLELLEKTGNEGMTNREIAVCLDADYARVRHLTVAMWENGALARSHVGDIGGAMFYFLPVTEAVENEQPATAV
jgi:hypothetical protein